MSEDSETVDVVENAKKEVNSQYDEAIATLKKNFKAVYEKSGIEWTEENDKEIEDVLDSIVNKAIIESFIMSSDLLRDVFIKKK